MKLNYETKEFLNRIASNYTMEQGNQYFDSNSILIFLYLDIKFF